MTVYPTTIECVDEYPGPVVTLTVVDDAAVELRVERLVNAENWPEISDAIMRALRAMEDGI